MNLSNKQITALVKEILPNVQKKQREQLDLLKDNYKKEISDYVESNVDISRINWDIATVVCIKKSLISFPWWEVKTEWYYSTIELRKDTAIGSIINLIYTDTIKKKFVDTYWKEEIKAEDIEHEIILATIWASTIEELVNIVTEKLIK